VSHSKKPKEISVTKVKGETLYSSAGDDFLNGGGGADTYVFNLTLRSLDDSISALFRDGDTPNQNANWQAWDNYLEQLQAWRAELTALYGADANTSLVSNALYRMARDEYGEVPQFDPSYDSEPSWVLDTQGNDTIAQLVAKQGDRISVNISREIMEAHATTSVRDVDGDGELDTVLEFSGNGQIVILGSSWSSISELWDAGLIIN
jgi:hypothetical protein